MIHFYKYAYPADKVKLCKKDTCIEARGQNGQLVIAGAILVLISMAAYYISKIK